MSEQETWLSTGERGALLGIRFVLWLATALGRAPARGFVALLVLWYAAFDRTARRASKAWHERVHGRPAGFWDVYRHLRCFSNVALDRIFFLKGKTGWLKLDRTGTEHLQALKDEKQGAILLGAHLGSFEAMRAGGQTKAYPINIVGYFQNAKMINALFDQLNPDMAARVIHTGENPIGLALKVRQCIENGELVALLGDRVGLNDKAVNVQFMGDPAPFATGPFLLAHAMKCPVYLVFGLYTEPNHYHLHCEPFADRIELPRSRRQAALTEAVQRYADRVEHYARTAPNNWFNFYDFWQANNPTNQNKKESAPNN